MSPPLAQPETCDRCGAKTHTPSLAPGGEMLCPKCKAEWLAEHAGEQP